MSEKTEECPVCDGCGYLCLWDEKSEKCSKTPPDSDCEKCENKRECFFCKGWGKVTRVEADWYREHMRPIKSGMSKRSLYRMGQD